MKFSTRSKPCIASLKLTDEVNINSTLCSTNRNGNCDRLDRTNANIITCIICAEQNVYLSNRSILSRPVWQKYLKNFYFNLFAHSLNASLIHLKVDQQRSLSHKCAFYICLLILYNKAFTYKHLLLDLKLQILGQVLRIANQGYAL